jgi:hypothetical protein
MKFAANNKTSISFNVGYDNKTIEEVLTATFLGLKIVDNINWKEHIDCIYPQTKFSTLYHEDSHSTVESRYFKISFSCFHLAISYGVIFLGNSADSKRAFIVQKKIFRIMAGVKRNIPCR